MDWLKTIKDDLRKATVVHMTDQNRSYDYIVNPLSSGVPAIPTEALWGCAFEVARIADLREVDKIVTPEAMGIHIASALSMVTGKSMLVLRKRPYFLPGEIEVVKQTAYSVTRMYVNGLKSGDRVLLVDSIISTGGTFSALTQALQKLGVKITDAVAVIERIEEKGVQRVKDETGVDVKTLVKIRLESGKVHIEDS
jgi:adenine phosphoribosyltransferase